VLNPSGEPPEEYRAWRRGYILAASHTIRLETPDANIFALYEVAGVSRKEIRDRAADIRRRSGRPG
jgi:hypothetical protein